MNKMTKAIVGLCAAFALALGGATSAHAVVGDPNGQRTYVPGPTYIDDCGTANDKILVGNTAKLNWWVYKNADGRMTASAFPKPGFYVDDGTDLIYDFPAYTNTCKYITSVPKPVRTGSGPYDISFVNVPNASWRQMVVSGGTKMWLQPNIGWQVQAGVTSSWIL